MEKEKNDLLSQHGREIKEKDDEIGRLKGLLKSNGDLKRIIVKGVFALLLLWTGGLFAGEFFFSSQDSTPYITESITHSIFAFLLGVLSTAALFYWGSSDKDDKNGQE